jgi:pilus assembly protein Flp/PilA
MTVPARILALFDRLHHNEEGQGLAEYALILALIAVVAIIALLFMGSQVSDKLNVIGTTLQSVT